MLRFGDDRLRVDTLPKTFIKQKNVLADFKYTTKDLLCATVTLHYLKRELKTDDHYE